MNSPLFTNFYKLEQPDILFKILILTYFYVSVQELFPVSWRVFHSVEYLCVRVYYGISVSH